MLQRCGRAKAHLRSRRLGEGKRHAAGRNREHPGPSAYRDRTLERGGSRMALEVKSVELLGMPVAYACAVKAGPWVFLTGHEAFDWETGEVDASVSGPAGFPAYGTPQLTRSVSVVLMPDTSSQLPSLGATTS